MKIEAHLFLIGFMGVGKTSVSRQLSQRLQVREVDTDAMIVQREGRSIPEIFEQSGEAYFRQAETEMLDVLGGQEPCIVSCGGGMVMREENVEKMKDIGRVVFLTATPETIYERVKDSTNRPLLNGNMNVPYIKELMEVREPKYRAAADVIIATDGRNSGQVADGIMQVLE